MFTSDNVDGIVLSSSYVLSREVDRFVVNEYYIPYS